LRSVEASLNLTAVRKTVLDLPAVADLTLDATGSTDPLKATLTYQWTLTAAPPTNLVKLGSPTASKATFAPVVAGNYVITLVVNNGTVDSNTVTLLLKVI
jgi:hypothetical protein